MSEISKEQLKKIKQEVKQELKEEQQAKEKERREKFGEINLKPSKRNLHYKFDTENNPNWKGQKDVWLKENVAASFHATFMQRGAKYLGDQNGNMRPPRDFRAAFYKTENPLAYGKGGSIKEAKKPKFAK